MTDREGMRQLFKDVHDRYPNDEFELDKFMEAVHEEPDQDPAEEVQERINWEAVSYAVMVVVALLVMLWLEWRITKLEVITSEFREVIEIYNEQKGE